MKLRNKITNEICNAEAREDGIYLKADWGGGKEWHKYGLGCLGDNWEYYVEPKDIWWLDNEGQVNHASGEIDGNFRENRKIGNYFLSREEAEKAVEKLKAWKRLKDRGLKVDLWDYDGGNCQERIKTGRILFRVKDYEENDKDLDLLFGGEEE